MKGVFWKEGEPFTNSMSLIVSLLIRYPEIATLKLDPQLKCFIFSFMIMRGLPPKELKSLRTEIQLSLEVFADLTQQTPTIFNISFRRSKGLTLLEVKRDSPSLSQDEIALLVSIVKKRFHEDLAKDQDDEVGEDEQYFQEEMIDHMLEDLKDTRQEKMLIGIREDGRVMIFNR